ncbi:MAG: beta strand repeat-containing protein [Isosphaerales bacterium]
MTQWMSCKALKRRRSFHAAGDHLESRIALSGLTVFVTSPGDAGTGTLRAAIMTANANPGTTIDFRLQLTPATINLVSPLPQIIAPTTIDGTSQPGYKGTPLVTVNGSGVVVAPSPGIDFEPGSGGSLIEGLEITGFNIAGITVNDAPNITIGGSTSGQGNVISGNPGQGLVLNGNGTSGVMVEGNQIGTDSSGTVALPNGVGMSIVGATANTIGGSVSGACNVISGNAADGVEITGSVPGSVASRNVVECNLIGTNAAGTAALPNGQDGVGIDGSATNNTIGGTLSSELNVISGNTNAGISISGPGASGNTVAGNLIGTNSAGTAALANGGDGVSLDGGATANTIGGTISGARNVISGSTAEGVAITGDVASSTTTLNVVEGNDIGTNAAGTSALANGDDGVKINGFATNNTIGGSVSSNLNVISGNLAAGVAISGSSANRNTVAGNEIGTDSAGAVALANGIGVSIVGATANTIGGAVTGARNVISGNTTEGVEITGSVQSSVATLNVVEGNFIGTNTAGRAALANGGDGISIDGSATNNTIGGSLSSDLNVISGNTGTGVVITGSGANRNTVAGNDIGTDSSGTVALANHVGVEIIGGATNNTIGGSFATGGNMISGNTISGIYLHGSVGTQIVGNQIGTDASGQIAIGNGTGVLVDNGMSTSIGGTSAGAGNVISGNVTAGVELYGNAVTDTQIVGDYIGTNAAGNGAVANGGDGVSIIGGATANTIGGIITAARNVISGNKAQGVEITGPTPSAVASLNVVEGNFIGTNTAGTAALANGRDGVLIDGSATNNTIGGSLSSELNVISGNTNAGVAVTGPGASGNTVAGNLIGLARNGTDGLANGVGVAIVGATANTIGGVVTTARNVISGNTAQGIDINGFGQSSVSSLNVVEGNFIGTNIAGTAAVPNGGDGVRINGSATNNTIGGSLSADRNVISGNTANGIEIASSGASGDTVEGNYVGTDASGQNPLGNDIGVLVSGGPPMTVGGVSPGEGNVISGNFTAGIELDGGTVSGIRIEGNLIGTDSTGSVAVARPGRSSDPLQALQNAGVVVISSQGNTIGGDSVSARNVISGNYVGVMLATTSGAGNLVLGNLIGTDMSGKKSVGNIVGIYINGAADNQIGLSGIGNTISGNSSVGVEIYGSASSGNSIEGNTIGLVADGLFTQQYGIFIQDASNNVIGGTAAGAGNVISGNESAGVFIQSHARISSGNSVDGNDIGLGSGGSPGPGNNGYGIVLFNAPNNPIGRTGAAANHFGRNGIADIRDFTGPASGSQLVTVASRTRGRKATHPAGPAHQFRVGSVPARKGRIAKTDHRR